MPDTLVARWLKPAFVISLAALLTAAKASIVPLPQAIMPAEGDHAVDETFVVHKGDVIMRAKVYDAEVVTLDAPVSVTLSRFAQTIPAGTRLEPELVSEQTTDLVGTKGRFYCGENQRARSAFAQLMLGGLFSKYEEQVRFCFVDSDKDGKLDKYFLAGAKDKAEQGAREIEPVAFTTKLLQPDLQNSMLELRVEKFNDKANKIKLRLYLVRDGKDTPFDYILTVVGGEGKHTYPTFETDPKKVPYPAYFNNILGGGVGVTRVDAVAGEAEVKITKPFRAQLFKPVSIIYQVIYIYY